MGKFKAEENLDGVIRLMMLMGTWPMDSSSILYTIRGYTTIFLIASFTVTTIAQALEFVDTEETSFALCCVMASFHTVIKYFFLYTKKAHVLNLIKILNKPILSIHDDHLDIFLIKKLKMCRFFQHLFLYSAVGTGVLIVIIPLLNMRPEKSLPVPFPMNMEQQSSLVHISVWLFQGVAVILTTTSIGCFDGLLFFFIAVAAAELRILREKIAKTINLQSLDSQNMQIQDFDNRINNLLKDCVKQHIAIERYITSIQTTFSSAFLIQLLVSLLITCLIGFTLILIPIVSIDFGMCTLMFVAASTELVLFCAAGNEITLQSENIRDACYMSQWVNCGPSVRKTLFIIMERSKRPFKLSAAGFVFLSLDTLVSVSEDFLISFIT
ncbi:hypothetical protein ILUMI_24358 [Ignelater luminosus]|uniref:Odorant receptor n=1 Tax=Ignelater luminosus TaxID=2038154 RepID=A0A8K0FYT7_IGNLU|nr:hypothetical protein ILUMI_24358 [Ignelater luminosus]